MHKDCPGVPGFCKEEIDPESAQRLVLRFSSAAILVRSAEKNQTPKVSLELELRGEPRAAGSYKLSIRRSEGILIVADKDLPDLSVSEVCVRVPSCFRDIEIHSASGSQDIKGLDMGILAESESGAIRVLAAAAVEASSSSGSIEVEGGKSLSARLGSGSLRCLGVEGPVTVDSRCGDVLIDRARGNVVVAAGSGDVSIQKPAGRLRVSGGSGDVELDVNGPFLGGEVSTNSGDISLTLASADLELRAETLSGNLAAEGASFSPAPASGPRRCAMRLGSGGKRLHARSVSGDIEIEN